MSTSMTSTSTSMSMSSASASPSGGMSMGDSSCKISMTWNWYTVGACFISKSWQVSSDGIFALSCIGVILLVISLEFLRRVQREYDSWIRRKDQKAFALAAAARNRDNAACASYEQEAEPGRKTATNTSMSPPLPERPLLRRPQRSVVDRMTLLQRQCIRSLIHMVQFGVAYFIMLLAMYYNGTSFLFV
ncbi:Ctr copper transporter family protein [Fonsecaea pedrosoi]|nr:Ctr copper transporter family protein [Fonsecaea pedrosoi]